MNKVRWGIEMDFQQLRVINREIEILKDQIYSLEPKMTADKVKGSCLDFPYTLHEIKISGVNTREYDRKLRRLRRKLQLRLGELIDMVEEMNRYLDNIEDSEIRQILSLRYIKGFTWRQIALHMGREGDGSTERKKHDRFLKDSPNSRK